MHELSIARSIIEIVTSEAEKAETRKVTKVSLKIGDLTCVFPDALTFCFKLLSKGTIVEGASLAIEKVPIRGSCLCCGKKFLIEENRYVCPFCRNKNIELTTGRELQIDHVEVENETN